MNVNSREYIKWEVTKEKEGKDRKVTLEDGKRLIQLKKKVKEDRDDKQRGRRKVGEY
jgi:hypothetical protein